MLRFLSIQNYAILRELELTFPEGFITLTGETGAGKSILLGALSLILGERADIGVLLDKHSKCIVEGSFDGYPESLKAIFEENDIDAGPELLLRREINPAGKSRAFINDTPVNLQLLREVGILLIDIHSQHENLELNTNHFQLSVIDAFAGLNGQLKEYSAEYRNLLQIQKEYRRLKDNELKNKSELDFNSFLHSELQEARLREEEQEALEEELQALTHAEEIKSGLFQVWQKLDNDEVNVAASLKDVLAVLTRLRSFHKPSESLYQRIEASLIEIRDIASEVERLGESLEHDPGRLEKVQERLNLIYNLQQKHRVSDMKGLIQVREEIELRLKDLAETDFRIAELEKKQSVQEKQVSDLALALSKQRERVIPEIQKKIREMLIQLGIPSARFEIDRKKKETPGESGIDTIRFLFTANSKTELQDISKIASGGELSRLMLSIKSLISGSLGLPTIIFDEIDTGVSGEIAHRVGKIMKDMAADRQVISITHLPQVASRGENQFKVYKTESPQGTTTRVTLLNNQERLEEIARMLSGEQTTEAAIANAKELLKESN
jgi:DNA repair protein RecN (Recombination protein N)